MILGTEEMAASLGISPQRLTELARRGAVPRAGRGQWDVDAVKAAIVNNLDLRWPAASRGEDPHDVIGRGPTLMPGGAANRPPEKGTMAHAVLMHQQAKAARAALEAQKLEGKLVPVREVEQAWAGVMTSIRSRMLLVPDKIAVRVAAESSVLECRALIAAAINEALTAASEYDPNAA